MAGEDGHLRLRVAVEDDGRLVHSTGEYLFILFFVRGGGGG